MSATAIIPKCRLDPHSAAVSPKSRPAPAHTPARRLRNHTAAALALRSDGEAQPPALSSPSPLPAPLSARALKIAPDGAPHVLHIDTDTESAIALAVLLCPEARVTHVPTLGAARAALRQQIFSVVVIDPNLLDGDAAELLPALSAIPLVVYSATQPHWRNWAGVYLPKPRTSQRKLWSTLSKLLGIPTLTFAGD
jgi:two-component system phosphate regulon response regulator OmpR